MKFMHNGKSYILHTLYFSCAYKLILAAVKYFKVMMIKLWFTSTITLVSNAPKRIMQD